MIHIGSSANRVWDYLFPHSLNTEYLSIISIFAYLASDIYIFIGHLHSFFCELLAHMVCPLF